jgi:hypothetical protein
MLSEMYYWMIFYLKKVKTNDMPQFNAYLLICVLVNANLLTIVMGVSYLMNFDLTIFRGDSKYIGLVGGLSLMIFNYFYLFRQRKKIIDKYDQFPQKRRVRGIISFWIYSILSLSLLFIAGVNLTR